MVSALPFYRRYRRPAYLNVPICSASVAPAYSAWPVKVPKA
jgi:hypothetical protein